MTAHHPVDDLLALLRDFGPYPPGVVPIPERIRGTAFFPGGSGLWNTEADTHLLPMPVGGVMLVGNNFDCEAGYQRSLRNGIEYLNGSTWRPLRNLLPAAGIPLERCFFTNAYVGLLPGDRAMGELPAARNSDFRARCQRFFLQQLRVVQPQVVVALGRYVPPFLAPLSADLPLVWARSISYRMLDQQNAVVVYPVHFATLEQPAAVVALVHPSYRHRNAALRRYKGLEGDAAEVAMLRDAVHLVGGV